MNGLNSIFFKFVVVLLILNVFGDENLKNGALGVSINNLRESFNFAIDVLEKSKQLETNLKWANIKLDNTTPEYDYYLQNMAEPESLNQAKSAYITILATHQLKQKLCKAYNPMQIHTCLNILQQQKVDEFIPSCDRLECSRSKYRSIDGSCNHENNGVKGRSKTAYKRLIKANYLDGIDRVASRGVLSPRKITTDLFQNRTVLDERYTLNVLKWTEFIFNDLSHTVKRRMVHTDEKITCCTPEGANLSPRYLHPFCLPVKIPHDDYFYAKHDIKCISYVRSVPSISDECTLGPLEQMNQATHYLDASHIYGTTIEKSQSLRFKDGLLKYQLYNYRVFPPFISIDTCSQNGGQCFDGGDPRLNLEPLLTTLYTLFLREHNRIANELKIINPQWNDNILFEETRRIVIAEIQHITYNEFLPILLGDNIKSNFPKDFNQNIDPRVTNTFSTVAMKYFTSLYDSHINLYDSNGSVNSKIRLNNTLGQSLTIINYFDKFLTTLLNQKIGKVDLNIPDDLQNNFFSKHNFGLDLISLTIQRARDHGIPSYTAYRRLCDPKPIKNFNDLRPLIPQNIINILAKLYKRPEKIDLFVGALSERVTNGILGPTFSCIINEQFARTKGGDRYFYSNKNQPGSFTDQQLNEIENVSLAMIFCNNGNDIKSIQKNAFKAIDNSNVLTNCEDIPQINLKYWAE